MEGKMPYHLLRPGVAGLVALLLTACAGIAPTRLPPQLVGKAVAIDSTDPDYGRAMVDAAVKPAGQGGVSYAIVVKLSQDLALYRLWNGPGVVDSRGNTNRLGAWWTYDPPAGSVPNYRVAYEVCQSWNQLAWVVRCTLKAGAVAAIGPGQSVTAATCGDASGAENYPANANAWQMYVDQPWKRPAELVCPAVDFDSAVDPDDLSRRISR
jgi:hypothetical protein